MPIAGVALKYRIDRRSEARLAAPGYCSVRSAGERQGWTVSPVSPGMRGTLDEGPEEAGTSLGGFAGYTWLRARCRQPGARRQSASVSGIALVRGMARVPS